MSDWSNWFTSPLFVSINLSMVILSDVAAMARLSRAVFRLEDMFSCVAECAPKFVLLAVSLFNSSHSFIAFVQNVLKCTQDH